ncbi:hypothetical protein Tmar_1969 [Thermaerobacter marianensis DSM 12885]|uniref:Uncharacterized protein n=1 Tax=Thermaerobacter marianensis (strain ATCC 700841 / DSM 12885 / JCM 10246 / 7p75a) TaxID=644966 RepID=E6SJ28_THEM7|nr:hypothetical protein [Thermaerobacter marianensis]ADU52052.1 hypothetical protein Tmar_1969 [Thermaerobacter marianensis DSM 12885]
MGRGWRWAVAGLAAVVVGGAVAWFFTPGGVQRWQQVMDNLRGPREPDSERVEAVTRSLAAATPEELDRAQNDVRAVHERMNDIAGWANLSRLRDPRNPAWDDVREVLEGATLQFLRQVAPRLEPETVGQDLEAFVKALDEGYAQRDPERIRVAHRIIHDLDYFVFNHATVPGGSRNYWGATITLEGDDALAREVLGPASTGR